MVRQPILWIRQQGYFNLPLGDPIAASLEAASKGDIEEVLNCFLRWFEARFATEFQIAQTIASALTDEADFKDIQDPDCPAAAREELRIASLEGFLEIKCAFRTKDCITEVKVSRLGTFLRNHRGRVIGGRKIKKSPLDDRTGRSYWGMTVV